MPAVDPTESARTEDRTPDGYSAAEAARVIGISERRVRQLVDAGRLTAVGAPDGPLRIAQEDAHREREARRREEAAQRRSAQRRSPMDSPAGLDVEALVARIVTATLPLMLEPARRAEESAQELAAQERSLRLEVEARLALERQALAEERAQRLALTRQLEELRQRQAPADDVGDAPRSRTEPSAEASDGAPRRRWRRLLGLRADASGPAPAESASFEVRTPPLSSDTA